MTLRLVALMGVVLLLCLGAFGLLANHYQQQVMDEAAEIASQSAKAVFDTLDGNGEGDWSGLAWHTAPTQTAGATSTQAQMLIIGDVDPDEARKLIQEMTARRLGPDAVALGDTAVRLPQTSEPGRYRISTFGRVLNVDCDGQTPEDCVQMRRRIETGGLTEIFVSVEDIHARSDEQGVMLTIPTFTTEYPDAAKSPEEDSRKAGSEFVRLETGDQAVEAMVSEIHLPIPVNTYEDLFDRMRRQSLFLFFGVFLVGIALSAGAAARFTRPARKLDAALRELSEGDLETEVDVRGTDEIARLGIAFNDMTRKMRANRERAREMIRRDKLSALGRLAAGVAHDVRNPLHSIGLTLSHLTDTGRPEETTRRAQFDRSVAMIRGEIRRLDQLVVNFLRFANGEHRASQTVHLRSLVEETATLVKKETEWRSIELVLELEDVPEVEVDVEAIRSSLLNLVLNSCEAMPEGGKLTLALRHEDGEIVLEVADTGRGIPSDQHEKVFDFGYSTREGGSGLGLVMVHQCIVEDHGGRVTLESEEDRGTRVRLVLPVDEGTVPS